MESVASAAVAATPNRETVLSGPRQDAVGPPVKAYALMLSRDREAS
jgi:hypothetical protein